MTVTPASIQSVEDPVVERPPRLRELHPVVDAGDLARVGGEHGADLVAVAAQDLHDVGEVLLLLARCPWSPA